MFALEFWNQRPVLVTGGAGFVGSQLARQLVELKASVRVADNLSTGSLQLIADILPRIELRLGDVTRPAVASSACEGIDMVFDLAATGVSGVCLGSGWQPEVYHGILGPALSILESAHRQKVRRHIYFSSSCVYNESVEEPLSEEHPDEGPAPTTHGAYTIAKRAAESHALLLSFLTTMEIVILRPFNIVGPGATFALKRSNVLPSLVRKAHQADYALKVLGTGKQRRSFIDVRDVAAITLLIAQLDSPPRVANLSAPTSLDIGTLARLVRDSVNPALRLNFDPMAPVGAFSRTADTRHLQRVIGDFPYRPIEESIHAVIKEYRNYGPLL